jgi:hypothetical protein
MNRKSIVSVPCSIVIFPFMPGFAYSRASMRPRSAIMTRSDFTDVPFMSSFASIPRTSSCSSRLNLPRMMDHSYSLQRPERLHGYFPSSLSICVCWVATLMLSLPPVSACWVGCWSVTSVIL